MMYAEKGNKKYAIEAAEKNSFLQRGFDIVDDGGNILESNPAKTIPYTEHQAALAAAQAELAALQEEVAKSDIPALKKDLSDTKAALKKAEKDVAALTKAAEKAAEKGAKPAEENGGGE